MRRSIKQKSDLTENLAKTENQDPLIIAFREYNLHLKKLFELQKLYGSDEESPDMARASLTWMNQLDRLVRITPTSLAGVHALVNVCLDPESVGPDHKLRIVALRSIDRALNQLLPVKSVRLSRRPGSRRERNLSALGIW